MAPGSINRSLTPPMSNKVRVAIVMPELFHGGAETQFRMLAEGLDRDTFEVTIIVEQSIKDRLDRDEDSKWIAQNKLSARIARADGLRSNSGNVRRLYSAIKLWFKLLPSLCRHEYDAMIVYSALGMRLTPLLRLFGVITIFSERNAGIYTRIDLLRKRFYFAAAHAIVCNSKTASENYLSYGLASVIIENAVALPARKMPRQTSGEKLTLLVPARISPVKNQALVLAALPSLDAIVDKVYLAGAIEDAEYLDQLTQIIDNSGLYPTVEILGFVSDMDMLYERSDVIVLPSRSEGMPNVLLEAMARERPCVASDIPSNREILRDGNVLFDVDSTLSFADTVRYIAQLSADETQKLTHNNRVFVERKFSVDAMVRAYSGILMLALEGRTSG